MYCETKTYTIGKFFVEKNSIELAPEYQRQAGVWGLEKQQLFLHTLFGQYDVPKIYMHKLPINGGLHAHALVDGKQRLECIWGFLDGKIALGDHHYEPADAAKKKETPFPSKGDRYGDLTPFWQEQFKSIQLDVVVIHDAELDDIEELFFRLNNGEPLNAAEKRNAMGGKMCRLIREVAEHKFFKDTIFITNKRYQHYDLAARFLLIEQGIKEGASPYRDLKKRFLDNLVQADRYRNMGDAELDALKKAVDKQLKALGRVFSKKDPLLKRAGYPQLYYLFVKEMESNYAGERLFSQIKKFLPEFAHDRAESLHMDPDEKSDEKHAYLDEFERLMQQGNDKLSLEKRVNTMKRFFLLRHPETKLRDKRRNFSEEERYAIFIRSGEKCEECGTKFRHFGEFQADHAVQWAHGGGTTLRNARALCQSCNARLGKPVA